MFTKLAYGISVLVLILCIFRIVMVYIFMDQPEALRRYVGSVETGEVIDRALITALIAIALGVLAEISQSLERQERLTGEQD